MEMTLSEIAGAAKIALTGRLDTPGVDHIETRFTASVVPPARNTIVDLSGVSFMSSMGIRMLIAAARALAQRKGRMVLFGAQPLVADILTTAGLGKIVPIAADEIEALARLSQ